MKKVVVLLDFIQFRIGDKIEFYLNVIACMTGNTLFVKPDVDLAALTEVTNKLVGFYRSAQTGLHQATAKLHECEQEADELFRTMARYVDRIANGSEATILSAGFNKSNQPKPATRPIFSAEYSENPNEIVLKCKAVTGARSYVWQYAIGAIPVKEEDWKLAGYSTQATFTIPDLTSLSKYWFRFCSVTPDGVTPWSDPISKVVL
jgi:hypothetical protein